MKLLGILVVLWGLGGVGSGGSTTTQRSAQEPPGLHVVLLRGSCGARVQTGVSAY